MKSYQDAILASLPANADAASRGSFFEDMTGEFEDAQQAGRSGLDQVALAKAMCRDADHTLRTNKSGHTKLPQPELREWAHVQIGHMETSLDAAEKAFQRALEEIAVMKATLAAAKAKG